MVGAVWGSEFSQAGAEFLIFTMSSCHVLSSLCPFSESSKPLCICGCSLSPLLDLEYIPNRVDISGGFVFTSKKFCLGSDMY